MVTCYTKLLVLDSLTGRYIRISVDELKKSMRILNNIKKHRENKTVTLLDYCEAMGHVSDCSRRYGWMGQKCKKNRLEFNLIYT